MNNLTFTIIIPCYNEEKRLALDEFSAFLQNHPRITLLFVNDGSTDNTAACLDKLSGFANAQVLTLPQNRGKAAAIRAGMLFAVKDPAAQWIGFMDADLAVPLTEVENIFAHRNARHRILLGSRLIRLGAEIKRNWFRHFIGRTFATLASWHLRLQVYDTQCGAKFFHRDEVPELFSREFRTKWFSDVEMLRRYLKKYGRIDALDSICEVPLNRWYERPDSKISYSRCLKDLLILLCTSEKNTPPASGK